MKWLLSLLFVLAPITLWSQQKPQIDSVFQLTSVETITLANKIRSIQDSLRFKESVIQAQQRYINIADKRILLAEEQLKNREELVSLMHEKNVELTKQIEALRPKWYNNDTMWFFAGITTAVVVFVATK